MSLRIISVDTGFNLAEVPMDKKIKIYYIFLYYLQIDILLAFRVSFAEFLLYWSTISKSLFFSTRTPEFY